MTTTVFDQIQLRRGTAAVWSAANPVLAQAEIGLETDTNLIKIGDGTTNWNTLAYSIGGVKTSAQLASVLSGASGSDSLVFGTGPTLSGAFIHCTINPQGGTTYTIALVDDSALITTSSATAVAISIPTDATLNFPIGTTIAIAQLGAGQVTVSAASPGTTTVLSSSSTPAAPATRAQGSVLVLFKDAVNHWIVDGDFVVAQTNLVQTSPTEVTNIVGAAPAATQAIYSDTSLDWLFTTNTANNFIINLAASASVTLNTRLAIGQTKTFAVRVTNGATPYYMTALQVDGVGVTPKWAGGVAPSAGDASADDIYTFVVTKTAASTYKVVAQMAKAA